MRSGTHLTPCVYSLLLSVAVTTTATRADTPFFWDDFDRASLEHGDRQWTVSEFGGELGIVDGSLPIQPPQGDIGYAYVTLPPVKDFSVRTQISFEGEDKNSFLGVYAFDPLADAEPNAWAGLQPDGWLGMGVRAGCDPCSRRDNWGVNTVSAGDYTLDPAGIAERDVNLQYDAVGDQLAVTAWLVGTEKPSEPQFTADRGALEWGGRLGVIHDPYDNAVNASAVRYFAVLPAVAGDFSASGSLDVDDINLFDLELRGESANRVFDLNEDARVTSDDRNILIKELFGASYGDSNLDGRFNSMDLVAVLQAGEYNDVPDGNSTWATGDWDGNGDFDAADLVLALQDGGYDLGPRSAVSSVPEPDARILLVAGLTGLVLSRRNRRSIK